jgi:hypothetical protein
MKKFVITLNTWLYGRVKDYAEENGLSVRAAVRLMINQFFKNKGV